MFPDSDAFYFISCEGFHVDYELDVMAIRSDCRDPASHDALVRPARKVKLRNEINDSEHERSEPLPPRHHIIILMGSHYLHAIP